MEALIAWASPSYWQLLVPTEKVLLTHNSKALHSLQMIGGRCAEKIGQPFRMSPMDAVGLALPLAAWHAPDSSSAVPVLGMKKMGWNTLITGYTYPIGLVSFKC